MRINVYMCLNFLYRLVCNAFCVLGNHFVSVEKEKVCAHTTYKTASTPSKRQLVAGISLSLSSSGQTCQMSSPRQPSC